MMRLFSWEWLGIHGVRGARRASRRVSSPLTFRSLGINRRGVRPFARLHSEHLESRKVMAAEVTNVTATTPDGWYKAGETIEIAVAFNELMIVSGTPTLELKTGDAASDGSVPTRLATFTGVTGNVLKFKYTVLAGDTSADLDYKATDSLSEGDGFIRSATSTDPATLTLKQPGAPGSLGKNKNIIIDTAAPSAPTIEVDGTVSARPKLKGTATLPSGEKLQILVNDLVYDVTPDSSNDWAIDLDTAAPVSGTFDGLKEGANVIRATVTDLAKNATTASRTIRFDSTAPAPAPTVTSLLTSNKTPTITGTATLAVGDTLSVTVDGNVFSDASIVKTRGTDAFTYTWSLNLATAIPSPPPPATTPISELDDGSYTVTVVAKDTADNTSQGTGTLTIDTTPPDVGGVAFNPKTPNGAYKAGEEIFIDVTFDEAIVLDTTLGEPRLLLNVSASAFYESRTANVLTFKYVVAPGDNIGDLDYADANALRLFGATIRDAAGNNATTTLEWDSTGDLAARNVVVDTTAPGRPYVTPLTTNKTPPEISGTIGTQKLETGETLTVVVNGATYTMVPVVEGKLETDKGTWTLPLATTAPSSGTLGAWKSGQSYSVVATVKDAAGNEASDRGANQITINTDVPIAPKVDPLKTNNPKPTLTGTATLLSDQTLSVRIVEANVIYTNVPVNDGIWELDVSSAIAKDKTAAESLQARTYNVVATVTDGAGNSASDTTAKELVIDTVDPTVLAVTSTNDGAFNADKVITIQVLLDKPVTVVGAPTLVLNTTPTRNAQYVSGGSTPTNTLTFSYKVRAGDNTPTPSDAELGLLKATAIALHGGSITDAFGNTIDDNTPLNTGAQVLSSNAAIVIDTAAPLAPTVESVVTNISPPTIKGTIGAGKTSLAPGETLTVVVNNATYRGVPPDTDGKWILDLKTQDSSGETALSPFVDGTYSIVATVTDAAGNSSRDTTTGELTILTGIKAAPTVDKPQIRSDRTPIITGSATLTGSQTLTVAVGGATYGVIPVDGLWELDLATKNPTTGALPTAGLDDGTYNVVATIQDAAGNKSSDTTRGELVIDATAPSIQSITSTTPDGVYKAGSVIAIQVQFDEKVTVLGSPRLLLNTGFSVPRAAKYVSSSENVVGTVLEFTYTVQGPFTTYGTDGDNIAKLEASSLSLGVASIRDTAGNPADIDLPSSPGLLGDTSAIELDTIAPLAPSVTRLVTGIWPPVISGFIGGQTLGAGEILSVTVKPSSGTAWTATFDEVPVTDGLLPTDKGTWSLDLANVAPTDGSLGSTIADGDVIEIVAEVRDRAGNARRDGAAGDLTIRTTIPAPPTVDAQRTRSATPTITGTLGADIQTLKAGQWLTVTVAGATYERVLPRSNGTWSLDLTTPPTQGTLAPTPNAWTDVRATITDGFNASSDTGLEDLYYDTAPPTVLVVRTTKPDGAYKAGEAIDIEVLFDEDIVLDIAAGQPTLDLDVGASPVRRANYVSFTGSLMKFTYTVQAGDASDSLDYGNTSSLALNGAVLKDLAGNDVSDDPTLPTPGAAGSISLLSRIVIDTTAPALPKVTRTQTGVGNPTVSGTIAAPGLVTTDRFTVTVAGATYERDRIEITENANADWTWSLKLADVAPSSGNPPTFKAGDIVNVVATVTDPAGNTSTDTTFNELKIVADGATIESVWVAPKLYKLGEKLEFVVTFADIVNVAPAASDPKWPTLEFMLDGTAGATAESAVYSGGTGTKDLRFRYTVTNTDLDTDGIEFLAAAVVLPEGATIQDSKQADVSLTFTPPTSSSNVRVDGVAPMIAQSGVGLPEGGTYETGDVLRFTVSFTEPVTAVGTPSLLVNIDGVIRKASIVASAPGDAPTMLRFEYTIVAEDASSVGISVTGVSLDGGSIRDAAGNDAALAPFTEAENLGVTVNRVGIDSVAITELHKVGDSIVFDVLFSGDVEVLPGAGDTFPRIRFLIDTQSGPKTAFADYVTGSGSNTLTFRYKAVAGDNDLDGLDFPTSRISLNGAQILDLSADPGRDASLFYFSPPDALAVRVDTVAPRVSTIGLPINKVYTSGDVLTFRVTFDEDVVATDTPTLVLTINGTAVEAALDTATSTARTLVFNYTILATDPSATAVTVFRLSLLQGTITDTVGNPYTASSLMPLTAPLEIDNTSPTVTITSSSPALKDGDTATITFTLSEASTDFTASDIIVTGGTLSNFTPANAAGTLYTADFTPQANFTGRATIRVAAGVFTDRVNLLNLAGVLTPSLIVDTVQPIASIAASPTLLRSGVTSLITIVLSEPSTTFTQGDVRIVGGTASAWSGSGVNYSFVFTAAAVPSGQATITIAPAVFTDAIGNDNLGSVSVTLDIDNVKPTVTITPSSYVLRAGQSAQLTFVLSEPSSNFTASDITYSGGTLGAFTQVTPQLYTATFTPLPQSSAPGTVSVAADSFTDATGNGNLAASLSPSITVDAVQPSVTIAATKTSLGVGESTTITFTLSEDSTDFTRGDITVTGGTLSTSLIKANGKVYTATFTAAANAPFVAIDVPPDVFTDAVGNGNLPGSLTTPISIVSRVLDVSSPTPDGVYGAGSTIYIVVTFDDSVFVIGTPTLALNAAAGRVASYYGTFGNEVVFRYTVAAGDATADLDYTSTTALALNGGTIRNLSGSNALLTLPAPKAAGSLGFNKAIAIDTAAPVITRVAGRTPATPNGYYNAGDRLRLNVTFSEPVKVSGRPTLRLNSAVARYATFAFAAPNDPRTLVFDYVVQPGDTSADLDASGNVLEGGAAIIDAAGNISAAVLPRGSQGGSLASTSNLVVDTTVGRAIDVRPGVPNGAYRAGSVVTLTVQFSEPVIVTGAPRLALNLPGRFATFTGGSGTSSLQFTYTVLAGDNIGRLDYASSQALVDATLADLAGNTVLRSLPNPGQPGSLAANAAIAFDTVTPAVARVACLAAAGTYGPQQMIRFQVVLSEPVLVSGTPTLLLNTIPARAATYVGTSGATLLFDYVTQVGDSAERLNVASQTALVLNSGRVADAAGNDAALLLPAGGIGVDTPIIVDAVIKAVAAGLGTQATGPIPLSTPVTRIPITFNVPVTGVSLQSFKLFYEGRSVALTGATLTGSGTSYVLTLPRTAVSLRGTYRLVVGGPLSGIMSDGVAMSTPSKFYWQRV